MKRLDLTGQRFGRLVAVRLGPKRGKKNRWVCQCDCGRESLADVNSLTGGHHQSCGCLHLEAITKHGTTKYGEKPPYEYRCWLCMKQRCNNPSNMKYADYGGRGIAICERWSDFANFLADMGKAPTGRHEIDRIDNDGPYSPENCRWATRKEQNRNRRNNRRLVYNGETRTVIEWSEVLGIPEGRIRSRLAIGWTIDEIAASPDPLLARDRTNGRYLRQRQ